jgi:hypothetical protein
MPSRSYAAFRIETPERCLGVLVFESVNSVHEAEEAGSPTRLAFDDLDRLQTAAADLLAQLLRASEFIDGPTVASLLPTLPERALGRRWEVGGRQQALVALEADQHCAWLVAAGDYQVYRLGPLKAVKRVGQRADRLLDGEDLIETDA